MSAVSLEKTETLRVRSGGVDVLRPGAWLHNPGRVQDGPRLSLYETLSIECPFLLLSFSAMCFVLLFLLFVVFVLFFVLFFSLVGTLQMFL